MKKNESNSDPLNKKAEPIDAQDGEDFTKELASRDDYGEASHRGDPSEAYHDYLGDSANFSGFPQPVNQQELWNRFKDWIGNKKNKKLKEDKDKVGKERQPESIGEGYWAYKNTPYVAPTGQRAEFMAMPAQKMGALKDYVIKKMGTDQWGDKHISFTLEFSPKEIKVQCSWDAQDLPAGLSEVETLSRVVSLLEQKLPEAFKHLKSARAEDLDLQNRTVAISIPTSEAGEK